MKFFTCRLMTLLGIFLLSLSTSATERNPLNYFNSPEPPADKPVIFAKGIVSSSSAWEEKISFTADGTEVFFGRHPDAGKNYFNPKVMHAEFNNTSWSTPKVAAFSKGRRLGWPLLSKNGTVLYLEEYEGKLFYANKTATGWSNPKQYIPQIHATKGFGLAQITDDNTLYFHARYERIAYSAKQMNGEPITPSPVSSLINPAVEFFVSAKNDYIIFQPLNWQNQLHISFKDRQGEWDMPIPFSTYFKNPEWDKKGIAPWVSADGKYLFLSIKGDIYWLKADFIEVLRHYKRPY